MHRKVRHQLLSFLTLWSAGLAGLILLPTLAAAVDPAFAGIEFAVSNESVPPGGMLQMKIGNTEPKPILKGKQTSLFSSPLLGPVRGIALFSPAGDASGVAVVGSGSLRAFLSSPLTSLGTNIDYPVLSVTMPVLATAPRGQQANLTLDSKNAVWYDPSNNAYPLILKSGVMTVAGTLSIFDIIPGGGLVPAGSKIVIKGMGFQPTSAVDVNELTLATSRYISSNEIDITFAVAVDMTGHRVRVKNPISGEQATYYSYARTTLYGLSTHKLVAASYPLFAKATWSQAFFKPVLQGTQFSGIGLQNLNKTTATVTLQLYSSQGKLLTSSLVSLPPSKRLARDYKEVFPGFVPATGTTVRVVSSPTIQMLGLLGDDSTGVVLPVAPSSNP